MAHGHIAGDRIGVSHSLMKSIEFIIAIEKANIDVLVRMRWLGLISGTLSAGRKGCSRVRQRTRAMTEATLSPNLVMKVPDLKPPPPIALGAGLVGLCLATREIINVTDAYRDPRFQRAVDMATGYKTQSVLNVPLLGWEKQPVGVAATTKQKQRRIRRGGRTRCFHAGRAMRGRGAARAADGSVAAPADGTQGSLADECD